MKGSITLVPVNSTRGHSTISHCITKDLLERTICSILSLVKSPFPHKQIIFIPQMHFKGYLQLIHKIKKLKIGLVQLKYFSDPKNK